MIEPVMWNGTRSEALYITTALLICLWQPFPAHAAASEEFGQLYVQHEHLKWPSPASIVNDLRSKDEILRFKALVLLGVPENLARIPTMSNATPSVVTGSQVVKPEQIELRYAALGSDETQQAVIAAEVTASYAFAAVAVPKGDGWERIATSSCWCKYDGDDVLDSFVAFARAPDPMTGLVGRFELIFRASGGGTGIYDQDEVHFRLYRGDLKAVMSFVSRVSGVSYGNVGPPHLTIERRWFNSNLPIPVLVEGSGESANSPTVDLFIGGLQDRYVRHITCKTFRWNLKSFRYEPISGPNPCKPPEH